MKIRIIKENKLPVQQSSTHKKLWEWWHEWRRVSQRVIAKYGTGHKTQRQRMRYYKEVETEFLRKLPIDIDEPTLTKELDNYWHQVKSLNTFSDKAYIVVKIGCFMELKNKYWDC